MKYFILMILVIWSIVWPVSCVARPRIKQRFIEKLNSSTGNAIAVHNFIQKYEKEHQKFYEEEIGQGDHLEWCALDNKNLSDYCSKFLKHSIPGRNTNISVGSKIRRVLYYEKENTRITSNIVIVECKVIRSRSWSYYMTRAPQPNCVYAVKRTNKEGRRMYFIINKYCDFEERSPKRKWAECFDKMHIQTGQPIAKDEYLLKYEQEHQELLRRVGDNDRCIEWPHAMLLENLNSYCYQYLEKCAPSRKIEGVTGTWKTEKLQYQKLHTNGEISVTIITCMSHNSMNRRYHITRALEPNCVYSLLRKNRSPYSPLNILFKHCDFENLNGQQTKNKDYDMFENNIIPQSEVKKETNGTSETLQLLPKD